MVHGDRGSRREDAARERVLARRSRSGCRSMSRVTTTGTSMPTGVVTASALAPFVAIAHCGPPSLGASSRRPASGRRGPGEAKSCVSLLALVRGRPRRSPRAWHLKARITCGAGAPGREEAVHEDVERLVSGGDGIDEAEGEGLRGAEHLGPHRALPVPRAGPSSRMRSMPPPQAVGMLSRPWTKPMRAWAAAMRRSQATASSAPPPSATPLSAATTGTGNAPDGVERGAGLRGHGGGAARACGQRPDRAGHRPRRSYGCRRAVSTATRRSLVGRVPREDLTRARRGSRVTLPPPSSRGARRGLPGRPTTRRGTPVPTAGWPAVARRTSARRCARRSGRSDPGTERRAGAQSSCAHGARPVVWRAAGRGLGDRRGDRGHVRLHEPR